MSHRKKRLSVGGSDQKQSDDHDNVTEAEPQIEQQEQTSQGLNEVEGGDMQEEIGRTLERTSIALGHLLQVVESTAQQVGRMAEEQQNSISFFASWHKYLKTQESEAQSTTGVGNSIVESTQQ